MPFAPINVILDNALPVNGVLSFPYPEGKNEGHFFSSVNHTLAVDGVFFRSPRDFIITTESDRIILTWRGEFTLRAGTLLNLQLEIPGGDFHFDNKTGVTVLNMVSSPLFMVNLGAPDPMDEHYWVAPTAISEAAPLKLTRMNISTARNVVIYSNSDNAHCTFTIEGEDIYHRTMLEKVTASSTGVAEGKRGFARVHRIIPSHACNGEIWIGTGYKLGLPVFLPSPGYLIREIINGSAITGGIITSAETAVPSATTGDRRGTYTPPQEFQTTGKNNIHLLLSLLNPGNIGIPDYAG